MFVLLPKQHLSNMFYSDSRNIFLGIRSFHKLLIKISPLFGRCCLFFYTPSYFLLTRKIRVTRKMDFGNRKKQNWDNVSLYKNSVQHLCYFVVVLLGACSQLHHCVVFNTPIVTFHRHYFMT